MNVALSFEEMRPRSTQKQISCKHTSSLGSFPILPLFRLLQMFVQFRQILNHIAGCTRVLILQ